MRALTINHPEVTVESLLELAEKIPGAKAGLRIAAAILILSEYTAPEVANLFNLTRGGVGKQIHKINSDGLDGVFDRERPGRPTQFNEEIFSQIEEALNKTPKDYGLNRTRWDGKVFVEFVKRSFSITITNRHAQRMIKTLGFSLIKPVYKYRQATNEGVDEFKETYKKKSKTPKNPRVKA